MLWQIYQVQCISGSSHIAMPFDVCCLLQVQNIKVYELNTAHGQNEVKHINISTKQNNQPFRETKL